jgi:acyl carrier protein
VNILKLLKSSYKMSREEIDGKVRNFLIEDLEIEEEKISEEARLKGISALTALILLISWLLLKRYSGLKSSRRRCRRSRHIPSL